jgi:hypothetical protein
MEPRKRTHLVNELMQEAQLRMTVLEKAMEGERVEESFLAQHGKPHPHGQYSLEDEHKSWRKVLRALTEIHTELEQIKHFERQRTEQVVPSASTSARDGGEEEDYTRV